MNAKQLSLTLYFNCTIDTVIGFVLTGNEYTSDLIHLTDDQIASFLHSKRDIIIETFQTNFYNVPILSMYINGNHIAIHYYINNKLNYFVIPFNIIPIY